MKIAFFMDPWQSIKAYKDTSYYLMLGASLNGQKVYHFLQEDLDLEEKQVVAKVQELKVSQNLEKPFELVKEFRMNLAECDQVWMRKDPPFNRRYFYTTLLLDFLPKSTKVINSPQAVRDWNEKLSALFFYEYGPRTLISQNKDSILEFINKKPGEYVLKPLDGFGGHGIEFYQNGEEEKILKVSKNQSEKIVVQESIPEAWEGDKRVLLWKGEVLGAILRKNEGQKIHNLDAGGKALSAELSERQKEICELVGKELKSRYLDFVGIDFLGDKLTEINVTSPTGLQELCRFQGKDYHVEMMK